MKYIRTMTQQKLSFWLALYIGWFMNVAVFFRRFDGYAQEFTFWKGLSGVVELVATVFVTFFLLRLLSLFGRRIWRILATLIVLFSAAASYYMTFLNVVIGYGIIASVMTTDIDLSKEVIGWHLILWLVAVSAPPLLFIWSNRCRHTLLRQLRTPGQRVKNVLIVVLAGLIVWGPIRLLELRQHDVERHSEVDMPSYGGVIANSYLPSNWLSALGLYAWAQVDESSDNKSLINPAKKFTYVAPEGLDDTYVVFIIGETTRWDHMGILGYSRNTTPELEKEKNLVAFRGYSCDTATKLSLRCMFVREGGAEDNPQRTLKEQNVFAVLGILSDKISRIRVITIGQVVSLVGMAALLFASLNALTFFAAIACVAFNFGGTITVFPSLVSEFFGLNNLAKNYGVIYLGFGIGSICGSLIASLFGGFYVTFCVIFALLILSLALSTTIRQPKSTVYNEAHA